jgi:transposase, IS5 family
VKLRRNGAALTECVERVIASLRQHNPDIGCTIAVDGSDIPAYANGQRYVSKGGRLRERFSDTDASWGHRSAISTRKGGGFYGYKLHAAVCTATGLPLAWHVATASAAEVPIALPLLDAVRSRGFAVEHAVLDKGYDVGPIYDGCEERGIRPIIPLRRTPAVVAGKDRPPSCEHGTWTFAGADGKRGASKWRCPAAECRPASLWIKADRLHTLVPRGSERWKALYRQRAAVEREFGRLKHEWGLTPLRVRRIYRVRLHTDLTILARLASALAAARAVPLAA